MRKNILLGAVLLSLLAVSCSKEQRLNNGNETETGKSISLLADISNGTGTRLTCEDDVTNKVLKFNWSDNESFKLYKGEESKANEFTKTAKGNIFTGTIPTGGTDTYYAVYGNNITNNKGELNINISSQIGVASAENGIATFMLAQAKYLTQASGMTPTLDFQHKLGVMKLTLTLPDGVTGKVSKVTISRIYSRANYILSANNYKVRYHGTIELTNGKDGFTINSDKKITVYVGAFPQMFAENEVSITAYVDDREYDYIIASEIEVKAGNVLLASPTIMKNLKSEYTSADYKLMTSENCKNAPNRQQMMMYLGAGVYWDDGLTSGNGYYKGNVQTYKAPDGKTYKAGLWVKRRTYIEGFSDGTAKAVDRVRADYNGDCWHVGRPAANEIHKYFFLPAAGYFRPTYLKAGKEGHYWSSTAYGIQYADRLFISNYEASVFMKQSDYQLLPMFAE